MQTAEKTSIERARQLLGECILFRGLTPAERSDLVTRARMRNYAAGETIFLMGSTGDSMMAVLDGNIRISVPSPEGKEIVLAIIQPGEVFGEIALLDGADRTADAVTMDDCEILVLERRDFIPFLHGHPDACLRLLEVLCQKLRQTSQLLEEALFLEGPSRLAKRLVHLAETFGKPVADGIRIDLQLSQQHLGNLVGMSRESMNKHLRQWREAGLIQMREGHYVITDLEALRQM
jgi:CRP/FNR family cyclic AMP-dependent transcriptional regulator